MTADRNTLLLLLLVFTVSVISLILVFYLSWQFAGDAITTIFNGITRFIHLQDLNYNFEIPE